MDKALETLTAHLDRAAANVVQLEPDDLQGLVALMDVTKEMAATANADDQLALFSEVAVAVEAVLGMLVLFQIEGEDEKQHAMGLVGSAIDSLADVLQHLPNEPEYAGKCAELLAQIGAVTGEDYALAAGNSSDTKASDATEADAASEASDASEAVSSPVADPDSQLQLDATLEADLVDEFVTEATEHLDSIEANLLILDDTPGDLEVINTIFRPFHTIKGVAGFLTLTPINKLAHCTEDLLDEARAGRLPVSAAMVDVVLASVDLLSAMVTAVRDLNASGRGVGESYPIKPLMERIKQVQAGAEVPVAATKTVTVSDAVPDSPPPCEVVAAPVPEIAVPEIPKEMIKRAAPTSIKVDTGKLDSLLNMVGELVVAQLQVRQDPIIQKIADQRLQRNLAQLSRITNELQKTAMSTRMVPIRATFQKMVRVVRDLSKKSGKQVELVMQGGDTEIDRNLVEEIYEPLMHMVRNSLDHGIEDPEERFKTAKPDLAKVTVGAAHKGDAIIISITDDGRGLDTEKIRAKAIERGLISASDNPDNKELFSLIFHAGFSTADKVTEVSGRGVGMDVVSKTIEKVRGSVEVDSELGLGTTVTIRLPLTLAIIDGMVVKVGCERFIVPTLGIMESFKPEKDNYVTVNHRSETLKVRGQLLPIIRLSEMFGIESDPNANPWDGLAVVVESDGVRCCLMVDALQGKQEIVIKSLGERMQAVDGVAGGAILGDGCIGLILDIGKIYRMAGVSAI